jgi:hypothetical protein
MPSINDTQVVPFSFGRITASNHPFPYDISGCIFAGLHPEGSLQVTFKYFVERIPTINDPNLLVLCKEPASYDPLALEIYNRACEKLPVAVRVGDNPLGEWFDNVMQAVGSALPAVGSALVRTNPALGLTLSGIGAVAQGARAINKQLAAKTENNKNLRPINDEVTLRAQPQTRSNMAQQTRNRALVKRQPVRPASMPASRANPQIKVEVDKSGTVRFVEKQVGRTRKRG